MCIISCLPMWLLPKIKALGEKIRKEILDKMEQIKNLNISLFIPNPILFLIHFTIYLNFFVCEYYNI